MNKQSVIVTILFMLAMEDIFNLANPIANVDKTKMVNYKKSAEERRKLPLFPKSNKKFVITETPVQMQPSSVPATYKPIKKPVMPKFIINSKKLYDNDWYLYKIPVTRRPLMKPATHFIDTVSTRPRDETINSDKSLSKEYEDVSVSQSYEHETRIESEAEKILTDEDDFLEDHLYRSNEEFATQSNGELDNYTRKYLGAATSILDDLMIDNSDIDNSEFIFIGKEHNIEKRNEEYTTIDPEFADKIRYKRNINIIEEENVGTTISGFQYTGKVSHSANDLSYKNINL